ncbi:MAG TPA: galactosyltransferase-related protein, partial [Thermoanaerobaculia bacterium]|nr:galactosyltransferase-related protein [Thermoanaerobaculia bacterium]
VSFLIGHRGRARLDLLQATLRSIAGQDIAVECIVVEQSRAPEVREALPPWVRYVHTPSGELPYCRAWAFNVAARLAASDVLVLHDGDLLVPQRYAAEAFARVGEGNGVVDLKRFLFYLHPDRTLEKIVQNAQGGSVVASRAAYQAIGGFDESFVGWGGEDNDFWDRARAASTVLDFGYLPLVHLHHEAQPGKIVGTPAIERYRRIESIPPAERIARLLQREQGRLEGPSVES